MNNIVHNTPDTDHDVYSAQGMQGDEPMVVIVMENDDPEGQPHTTFLCPEHARDLAADITAISIEVDYQRALLRPEVMAAAQRVKDACARKIEMTVDEMLELAISLGIRVEDLMRYSERIGA